VSPVQVPRNGAAASRMVGGWENPDVYVSGMNLKITPNRAKRGIGRSGGIAILPRNCGRGETAELPDHLNGYRRSGASGCRGLAVRPAARRV